MSAQRYPRAGSHAVGAHAWRAFRGGFALRSLLVPLDGTPSAEHALPHALALARRSGATLRLVHVHSLLTALDNPWQLYYHRDLVQAARDEKQRYLDQVMRRIARAGSDVPRCSLLVENADVVDALVQAACGADLVVMATHGYPLYRRLWQGSIAHALLRRLTSPMLLVRGYPAPVDLTGDPIPRHVLLPLDGSSFAERIFAPADALGALHPMRCTLLGVDAGQGAHATTTYLKQVAQRASQPFAEVDWRLVTGHRSVGKAVRTFAQREEVDLIAVTAPRRNNRWQLPRPSLARRLIGQPGAPVLVYQPAEDAILTAPQQTSQRPRAAHDA